MFNQPERNERQIVTRPREFGPTIERAFVITIAAGAICYVVSKGWSGVIGVGMFFLLAVVVIACVIGLTVLVAKLVQRGKRWALSKTTRTRSVQQK